MVTAFPSLKWIDRPLVEFDLHKYYSDFYLEEHIRFGVLIRHSARRHYVNMTSRRMQHTMLWNWILLYDIFVFRTRETMRTYSICLWRIASQQWIIHCMFDTYWGLNGQILMSQQLIIAKRMIMVWLISIHADAKTWRLCSCWKTFRTAVLAKCIQI